MIQTSLLYQARCVSRLDIDADRYLAKSLLSSQLNLLLQQSLSPLQALIPQPLLPAALTPHLRGVRRRGTEPSQSPSPKLEDGFRVRASVTCALGQVSATTSRGQLLSQYS